MVLQSYIIESSIQVPVLFLPCYCHELITNVLYTFELFWIIKYFFLLTIRMHTSIIIIRNIYFSRHMYKQMICMVNFRNEAWNFECRSYIVSHSAVLPFTFYAGKLSVWIKIGMFSERGSHENHREIGSRERISKHWLVWKWNFFFFFPWIVYGYN